MVRVPIVVAALAACAGLIGCSPYGGGGAFVCSMDTQCSGGMCSDGFCSFPDDECDSGQRYGELSGPRSGQCVGEMMMPIDMGGGGSDMAMNTADASACYGTGLVRACFTMPPSATVMLNSSTINTDSSQACDTDPRNDAWCVIAGSTIMISGTVNAIGTKPLVLVATSTITVNGVLDVASRRTGGIVGAGAGTTANCNAGTTGMAGGGGAGGSFGGIGGDAGDVSDTNNTGGAPGAVVTLNAVRGGCSGQNGNGAAPGAGGRGGGAVALIAETSITVVNTVNASGAGATGAANTNSGGGGGGSGGLIILDSPSVIASGSIFANGGGGGGGSGGTTPGQAGADPTSATTAAAGGMRGAVGFTARGGSGGSGSVTTTLAGGPGETGVATFGAGGGGGGGGAGIIELHRATTISGGGMVSPPPT